MSACTSTVPGEPAPAHPRTDVSDAEFPINLAGDSPTDVIARNSLADVLDYWEATFPEVFGADFGELEGGFWSIDPDETDEADLPDSQCFDRDVEELAANAFYCPPDDAIFFDRAWMAELSADFGPFVIAEIMAHEMAHAVQGHADIFDADSIVVETQAECFAGGWSRWVVDGNAQHFSVREPALDPYLLGYLYFGDPTGSDPNDSSAHGSLFDQLSAFQEGFADGPRACVDNFNSERLYTEEEFSPEEEDNQGNLPYDESLDFTDDTLAAFWEQAFGSGYDEVAALDGEFVAPELEAIEGDQPPCDGATANAPLDLGYCLADHTVRYDEGELLQEAHEEVGDFAIDTLLSIPYALAVREQMGLPTDDVDAINSAICLTGWYTRELYNGAVVESPIQVSPGDVDEAAIVLMTYATQTRVLPDLGLSGFELVDLFRRGFVGGGQACGLPA